jgi:transposase
MKVEEIVDYNIELMRSNLSVMLDLSAQNLKTELSQSLIRPNLLKDKKLMERVLVLETAKQLNNVTQACRLLGVNRRSFYEWKRRYDEFGIEGLRNKSGISSKNNLDYSSIEEKVIGVATSFPFLGARKITDKLRDEEVEISSSLVYSVLSSKGLATRANRIRRIEQLCKNGLRITEAQKQCIELVNPCFKEHHKSLLRLGELIGIGNMPIYKMANGKLVYLHYVIDCASLKIFTHVHASKHSQDAVQIIKNKVLPYYQERGIPILKIVACDSTLYGGRYSAPFKKILIKNNIDLEVCESKRVNSNGCTEFIANYAKDRLLPSLVLGKLDLLEVEKKVKRWEENFNERPYKFSPNFGQSPNRMMSQDEDISRGNIFN